MGKEGTRPPAYSPSLELYLRTAAEGGSLRVPAVLRGKPDAVNRESCVVLVHGFNNTDSEAATAYFAFRTRETGISDPMPPLDARFGDAFWPGDAHWWGWLDRADALVYPLSVSTARRAATEIARLLWQMPRLREVNFVAHSLGCRIVLETLLLLGQRVLPRVRRVCLMAAAVPSEMLEPGGRFFDLLRRMQGARTQLYVLHSMQDSVLHLAFPLGQRLAGAGEASSRALGRFGPSAMMPGYGDTVLGAEVQGAGHSHYWGHLDTSASRKANELVGIFLELGARARSVGTLRESPSARRLGTTRDRFERGSDAASGGG